MQHGIAPGQRRPNRSDDSSQARLRPGLVIVAGLLLGVAGGVYVASRIWRNQVTSRDTDPRIIRTVTIGREAWLAEPEFSPEATVEQLKKAGLRDVAALVKAFPDSAEAYGITARLMVNLGEKSSTVEQMWRRCIELDPQFSDGYFGLAVIAQHRGDFQQAATMFAKVTRLNPAEARAPALWGEALMKSGQFRQAVRVLEQAASRPDALPMTTTNLGQAYLHLKQYEKTRDVLQKLIAKSPEQASAYFGLAKAHMRLGDRQKGLRYLKIYRSLAAVRPEEMAQHVREYSDHGTVRQFLAEMAMGCALLYAEHGQTELAGRCWRKANVWAPKNTQALEQLLEWYESQYRLADAAVVSRQLCELQPNNPDHWLNNAILCGRLGQLDQAMSAATRAVQLAPGDPRYQKAYDVIRQNQ